MLLKWTRAVRLDGLSLSKMADRLGGEISKSELGRIMSGDDFPSWRQLRLLLTLFGIEECAREPWKDMWERLTAMQFESTVVSSRELHPPLDRVPEPPRSPVEEPGPPAAGARPVDEDELVEHHRLTARRVLTDAMAEAEHIVRGARMSAENERQTLIAEAHEAATRILTRAADEQAVLVHNAEQRIAAAFDTAEERLREVVNGLSSSVADTAGDVRRLVDDVRTSVATIRDDLATLHPAADRPYRDELAGSRYFAADDVTTPPVLGDSPYDSCAPRGVRP